MSDAARDPEPPLEARIDARLIDTCERHTRASRRLVREPNLPTWTRTPKLQIDPAAWRTGYLQVHERDDLPAQLFEDLHQLMPQALLRDLHRLVYEERWVERTVVEGSAVDHGGFDGVGEARKARQRPPLPRIEASTGAMRAHQRWRRALVRERWQPAMPDDQPRNPIAI
jgi:hypothetical protein